MAIVGFPGTVGGPCVSIGCGHIICSMKRDMVFVECAVCGKKIGYGKKYIEKNGIGLVHESCQKGRKKSRGRHAVY